MLPLALAAIGGLTDPLHPWPQRIGYMLLNTLTNVRRSLVKTVIGRIRWRRYQAAGTALARRAPPA